MIFISPIFIFDLNLVYMLQQELLRTVHAFPSTQSYKLLLDLCRLAYTTSH